MFEVCACASAAAGVVEFMFITETAAACDGFSNQAVVLSEVGRRGV